MPPAAYLDALAAGMAGITRTPVEHLNASTPSCPGWTVRDVIAHTGAVHRRAAGTVAGQSVPFSEADAPADAAVIDWYAEHASGLLKAMRSAAPGTATTSVFGERPIEFWFRRQTHEVAVHLWDIRHAFLGWNAEPIDPMVAGDGILEWSQVFAPRFIRRAGGTPEPLRGTRLDLADGDGAFWRLIVTPETVAATGADGPALATIHGSASDLLLALWHRVPLSRSTVMGDPELAQQILDLVRVT